MRLLYLRDRAKIVDVVSIEDRVRKRAKKQSVQQAVLTTIKVVGIISVGALAPNVLQLLKWTSGTKGKQSARVKRSFNALVQKGLVEVTVLDGVRHVRLTEKGEQMIIRATLQKSNAHKQQKWDGKWRIVTFDISERRKRARDRLRIHLGMIGFKKLQNSLWVYPYACEELVTLLKTDFKLGKEVIYLVAEEIEEDARLRRRFRLPLR